MFVRAVENGTFKGGLELRDGGLGDVTRDVVGMF
jgi:hypothetical protein